MKVGLSSGYFVCMSLSVCEHYNDCLAGRTRGKYQEDSDLERENIIKSYLGESGCEDVDWIQLA
jgi:hypothetical protein